MSEPSVPKEPSRLSRVGGWPVIVLALGLLGLVVLAVSLAKRPTPEPIQLSNPRVRIETSLGDVVVELDANRAPGTVANFLRYAEDGHYDGTIFHSVKPDFLVQGGGFTPELMERPTRPPIPSEAENGLSNVRGSLAMARASDRDPRSLARAQFFINVADNEHLNAVERPPGYTVFGRVVEGFAVVQAIAAVRTRQQPPLFPALPVEPVVIRSVRKISG